jgi:hypothetical protein
MFEWFNKKYRRPKYPTWDDVPDWNKVNNDMEKVSNDMSKVIPFPEVVKTPTMPEVEPPKEKLSHTYYRLGLTDNNRVSLAMGYSEVTFNAEGIDNLIQQLQVFRDQLHDDDTSLN